MFLGTLNVGTLLWATPEVLSGAETMARMLTCTALASFRRKYGNAEIQPIDPVRLLSKIEYIRTGNRPFLSAEIPNWVKSLIKRKADKLMRRRDQFFQL